MNIWQARESSIGWLTNELKPANNAIEEGFNKINELLDLYVSIGEKEGDTELGQFCRVNSIILAKYYRLLFGCFSLSMDGLFQESGALIRPLIEIEELFVYFRQDKTRLNQVFEKSLPSAGNIGKLISGKSKGFREYLNINASHFGFAPDSLWPLFDEEMSLKINSRHNLERFRLDLLSIFFSQVTILAKAISSILEMGYPAQTFNAEIEEWTIASVTAFSP